MEDKKNMALSDEQMAQVSGGFDPGAGGAGGGGGNGGGGAGAGIPGSGGRGGDGGGGAGGNSGAAISGGDDREITEHYGDNGESGNF